MQKLTGVHYTILWIVTTLVLFGVFAYLTADFWGMVDWLGIILSLFGLVSTGVAAVQGLLELKEITGG